MNKQIHSAMLENKQILHIENKSNAFGQVK